MNFTADESRMTNACRRQKTSAFALRKERNGGDVRAQRANGAQGAGRAGVTPCPRSHGSD